MMLHAPPVKVQICMMGMCHQYILRDPVVMQKSPPKPYARNKCLHLLENEFEPVINEELRGEPATNLLETSHGRRERVVEFFDSRRAIGSEYEWAMSGW
jgi:hypothetical protein